MFKGKTAYIILGIILLSALILRIFSPEGTWLCADGSWVKQGNPKTAEPQELCLGSKIKDDEKFILEGGGRTESTSTTKIVNTINQSPLILETPEAEATVSSPLVVKGKALGVWFFEASLPIKLIDSAGNLIAVVPAKAESDWMTDSFVPFSALLEFNTTATSGYLVISKDNPSGLPEKEASEIFPLKFLNK